MIDSRQDEANGSQPRPANHSPVKGEISEKKSDFYQAEEHTYSKVNVDHKKKASIKPAANGRESPVKERAMADGDAPEESREGCSS